MAGFTHKISSCKKVKLQPEVSPVSSPAKRFISAEACEENKLADDHSRFLGETEGLRHSFAESAVCRNCKLGELVPLCKTIGISTDIQTKCCHCSQWCSRGAKETDVPRGDTNVVRSTKHAANVLFALLLVLSGDGGTEAKSMLGPLDMHSAASFNESAYPSMECDLSVAIIDYSKELLASNLKEEMRRWAFDNQEFDMAQWNNAVLNNEPLAFALVPSLCISCDMGWQK